MSGDYSDIINRLQSFRAEAADLLAKVDAAHGPGTPGVFHGYLSQWAGALIALQTATPLTAPTPSHGTTTYNV